MKKTVIGITVVGKDKEEERDVRQKRPRPPHSNHQPDHKLINRCPRSVEGRDGAASAPYLSGSYRRARLGHARSGRRRIRLRTAESVEHREVAL